MIPTMPDFPWLPCLLTLGAPAVTGDLVFSPSPGSEVRRSHRLTVELEGEGGHWTWNGREKPLFGLEGVQRLERRVVTTDRFGPTVDGRPVEVRRTFEELAFTNPYEVRAGGASGDTFGSPLAGRTVDFRWDAESEAYLAELEGGDEGEAALLDHLVEDMDLRGMLPPRPLAEGGEGNAWDVPPDALARALFAGGDIRFRFDEDTEVPPTDGVARIVHPVLPTRMSAWGAGLEGEVEARHAGTREREGRSLTVVALAFDVLGESDASSFLTERCAGRNVYDDAPLGVRIAGTGELLWNGEEGRFEAFDARAELELTLEATWSVPVEGSSRSVQIEWARAWRGSLAVSAGHE